MKESKRRENPTSAQGVACPKCEHVNDAGKHTCRRCGSHLYVSCNACGAHNARVRSHCHDCGQRLHRGLWRKIENRLSRKTKGKVKLIHLVLLVASILLAYKIIVMLAEFQPPPVE